MSAVVPPPVPAARAGLRRLVLPALCASLAAGPLVAAPVLAGPALADAPAERVSAAVEETAPTSELEVVEPEVVESEVVESEVTVEPEAEPDAAGAVEPEVVVEPVPPTTAIAPDRAPDASEVPAPATTDPVELGDEDPDDVGPVPDDVARPDLVVAVEGPGSGWAGGEGAYTMSVANAPTATAPAAGFTLVYSVPAGQTVLSVDAPAGSDWACVLGDQASCTWLGELAAGEPAAPVTVVVGHGRRAAGRMTGTAQVTHLDGEVVLADNTAIVVTAMQAPDLALDVSAPDAAAAGDTLSIVLSVQNIGPGWASTFALYGSVPDGVTVRDLGGPGFACDVATLSCQYDDELAPGLSAAVTLTGVVDAAHPGGPMTTTAQIDQAAALASALTSVSAAKPVAVAPVVAPPAAVVPVAAAPVGAAPVGAAPVAPARAVTPVAVRPVMRPTPTILRGLPMPTAVTGAQPATQPATLPFTDTPSTLPFTGPRSGSQLAGGVALLLLGAVLTAVGRRRTSS